MIINVSKYAGFCFGVARAIDLVEKIIKSEKKPIFILGELVHNEHVIKKLKKKGIRIINSLEEIDEYDTKIELLPERSRRQAQLKSEFCPSTRLSKLDTFGQASSGNKISVFPAGLIRRTLVITAHGIDPKIISSAKSRGFHILNTTCPKVTKVHQIAKYLDKNGYKIFIYGDKDHIEVLGILGAVDGRAEVIKDVGTAKKLKIFASDKIGLISQTTQDLENFEDITKIIRSKCKNFLVFDTICDSTRERQADVKNLALNSDLMIVVGSKSSANTKRLYQISKGLNPKTYWIDDSSEIEKAWFSGVKSVGVTAGASTPSEVINDVVKFIRKAAE